MGIALQARHPNENLENNLQLESFSVSSVCSVDFLSSEFRRNLYGNKIFKKILTENTLEFLALWRDFLGIASEMLDI